MARYFFDTSALVKRYHAEAGTPEVERILAEPGGEFVIARLSTVEMLSGFAIKVRVGDISAADYGRLRGLFLADVRRRTFRPIRILNAHFERAGDLIGKYGLVRPLRTLDALQLAVALHDHRSDPVDHLVCADQRLCDVAAREGLSIINPERP